MTPDDETGGAPEEPSAEGGEAREEPAGEAGTTSAGESGEEPAGESGEPAADAGGVPEEPAGESGEEPAGESGESEEPAADAGAVPEEPAGEAGTTSAGEETGTEAGETARRWGWLRRNGRVVLFALAGAIVAVAFAGRHQARIGPFDATLATRGSWSGETIVRLAPLGTIELDTHDWPVQLDLRVDALSLEDAQNIAANPEIINRLGADVDGDVRSALLRLGLRAAGVAVAGGLVGALVARLSWRSAAVGTVSAGVLVVGVGAGTAATFNAEAVGEPRYTGLLTAAPTAVGNVESIIDRFGEYRAQLSDLVGNVVNLYVTAEGLSTFQPTDDTIRLLHVSDIHLNPQAFDLIEQVSEQFDVDAVLDTGDITDWGTSVEARIVNEVGNVDLPYVWVRGNHDSRTTQRAVAEQPNTIVLDDEVTTVAGVRIWGIGDPRFTPNKEEVEDTRTGIRLAEEFAPDVAERLAEAQPPAVDLVMVHDPRTAADLAGEVPMVLAGHRHDAQELRLDGSTVLLMEGSTGGAGLRALQGEVPEPLAATVLYFDPDARRVVAYDRIALQGLGQAGVSVERHILDESAEEDEDDEDDDGEQEDDGDEGEQEAEARTSASDR